MILPATRALLDRYALASRALSRESGERLATEAGQSVEFHDFRPYQSGDELRYVDWKVYARTGRLYTRLYQAERTINLHIILDTSSSMQLGNKARFSRQLASLLSYVAQRDARSQLHLFDGAHSPPAFGLARIADSWSFIEKAPVLEGAEPGPVEALKRFALATPFTAGAALVLVISDLFDAAPLRAALAAFRARSLDAGFLQVMSRSDLQPAEGQLELSDVETHERLPVGPAEVRAYKQAVNRFVEGTRSAVQQAGFRHVLLKVTEDETAEGLEQQALGELIRAGILVKR